MNSISRFCIVNTVFAIAALKIAGCEKSTTDKAGGASSMGTDAARCPHQIKQEKCPFCTPKLIEADGFCAEHGVAEALCYQCRPYLKAAFRAKGDWCKQHNAPDSQCVTCHPELKSKTQPGAGHNVAVKPSAASPGAPGHCEHGIERAKCPFCTPSLIETDGFCKEHNVAEALCVKCRPYLEKAFKAKNDWCAEHATPESQCVACNPELKNKKPTGG